MNTRLVTLLAQTAYIADAVETINLHLKNSISRLIIDYQPYNGNAASSTGHPVRCVPKIELIDGSKTLFELSGAQAHALDFYHRKKVAPGDIRYLNDNWSRVPIIIDFGRFLNDIEYAFDPTKFINPQLKITTDMDAGGSLSDAGRMTVSAIAFDGKMVSPVGFLSSREVKSYTLEAGAHEYTNMPVDMPYRKLFIRAQTYAYEPTAQIQNVKFSENQDDKVVLDHSMDDIIGALICDTPPYSEYIIAPGAAAKTTDHCTPGFNTYVVATAWRNVAGGGDQHTYNARGGTFEHIQVGAGPNFQAFVQGWCPHNVVEIPFGDQMDPADWYSLSPADSLKLDIHAGAAAGAGEIEIFLQQLMRY